MSYKKTKLVETEATDDTAGTDGLASEPAESGSMPLEEELEKCRKDAQTYLDKLQWLAADFDNYRKRMEKDNQRTAFQIRKEFLLGLLPLVDDLERGVAHARGENGSAFVTCADDTVAGEADAPADSQATIQESSLLQGMELIYQNMMKFLESWGVSKIGCLHSRFDPYLHEAVMVEENQDHDDGTILEIFQNGYLLNKETLRAAKVKVSKQEV